MQIKFIKPGAYTTVQDLGRTQYVSIGVPLSGAMDRLAATLGNLAVGNAPEQAVVEFTYGGAEIQLLQDSLLSYSGGGGRWFAGKTELPDNRPLYIKAGSTLYLKPTVAGSRSYLCIAGGWDVAQVMQSRSTYLPGGFGGYHGRLLRTNDILKSTGMFTDANEGIRHVLQKKKTLFPAWSISPSQDPGVPDRIIRIVPGPEAHWFTEKDLKKWQLQPHRVDRRSNRMGYVLNGDPIRKMHTDELLSTAVQPGTIQITNSGQAILLMADCQTTGGYPRIGQVVAVDLPRCAQLKPEDTIYFKAITQKQAEHLFIEQESTLRRIALAISLKYI